MTNSDRNVILSLKIATAYYMTDLKANAFRLKMLRPSVVQRLSNTGLFDYAVLYRHSPSETEENHKKARSQ
jgi:hypothetical protein